MLYQKHLALGFTKMVCTQPEETLKILILVPRNVYIPKLCEKVKDSQNICVQRQHREFKCVC